MNRKHGIMAALLIVLIGTFTLALNIRPVRATIRRVPEDYPTIQKAIDHAKNGDTVLVSAGTYIEDIVISDKSISLIGEDAGNTTIRNKTYDPGWCDGVVEVITSTTVLIKGFTITPSLDPSLNDFEAGIYIWSDSYNCTIMDCVIANFDNTVSPGTLYGIRLDGTQCTVRRNIIRNNIYGMYCHRALGNGDNIIDENILTNNQLGIYCVHDSQDGNNIKLAYGNNITENIGGINCFGSRLNKFYHNNFLDNEYCARTFGYPQIWDDGYPSGGNYWNDYTGEDLDGDGIGDTSYIIDENNRDNYPFINPWTPQAYDVATLGVIPYKNVVGQGFSLRINVTVENQGFYTQTFNIAAYANDTAIQTQTVTISSGNFTTVTFTWNTTGVSYSNYSISASASTVPGEIDTGDNTLVDGIVFVTITVTGDVNGDGEVDASDLLDLGTAYGPDPSKPNWNPNSDFNDDDKVDASDLFALSKNYGKTI